MRFNISKINIGIVLLCSIAILFILLKDWKVMDTYQTIKYDFLNDNPNIVNKAEISKIISSLETTTYPKLDPDYLDYTKSNTNKYESLVNQLTYYIVKRSDLNRKIVSHFRIKDFICKDQYYKDCVRNKIPQITCAFNPKIFYKTLELQQELARLNYDENAFTITNGHRHPRYNEEIGGAKLSRHIKGEAVDMSIGDINKDGRSDKADKDIVLDILETKIIGNEGGIGLYPGTKSVHFDVRGKRARWNSY